MGRKTMDLRNGETYSCAAVFAWLGAQTDISPGSAVGKRVLAGDQTLQVGPTQYLLEPLKPSLKANDVNQQFRVHAADKAEFDQLFETLEKMAPVKGAITVLVVLKAGVWAAGAMAVASIGALFYDGFGEWHSAVALVAAATCGLIGGWRELRFHRV
jgi:hypothetical protein